MSDRIFSPGKLLLTSEYVVLDGALALAVPTQPGQEFFFAEQPDGNALVHWEAYHQNKKWLSAVINYKTWEVVDANIENSAQFIKKVLKNVQQLSSSRFQSQVSYYLKTNLQFPADFGLGSSSTLMNNLAEWADIDPFLLNDQCLGGSGYDIAVAKEKSALLFQIVNGKKTYESINFNPDFKNELIFIHLNHKMDSRKGISLYRSKEKSVTFINEFTAITREVLRCTDLTTFSGLIDIHENKLSKWLGLPMAKDLYFKDCPVFVKSLGAWGGDFVMSARFDNYKDFFSDKGYNSVFRWNDIIG